MSEASFNLRSIGVCDRMLSDRELVGRQGTQDKATVRAAAYELARVRRFISVICGENAAGRVLVGSTLRVRRALQSLWLPPVNADFVHYNALRGVDFARRHQVAISIGRQELAPGTLDGLAAALGYDDEHPGDPADHRGDERSFERRQLKMRDGRNLVIRVPVRTGKWARLLQSQFREEELKQFAGRLRPVYRDGVPPVWYAMTQALPGEFIWDDLVSSTDVLTRVVGSDRLPRNIWELARRGNGLICPELALEHCPDLCNRDLMPATFATEGIDLRDGRESELFERQWNRLSWRDGAEQLHTAWASPWLPNACEHLEGRLREARYDVRAVDLVRAVQPVGYAKQADEVDLGVGSRPALEADEARLRAVHHRGFRKSTAGTFELGDIGLQMTLVRHGIRVPIYLEACVAAEALEAQRQAIPS